MFMNEHISRHTFKDTYPYFYSLHVVQISLFQQDNVLSDYKKFTIMQTIYTKYTMMKTGKDNSPWSP